MFAEWLIAVHCLVRFVAARPCHFCVSTPPRIRRRRLYSWDFWTRSFPIPQFKLRASFQLQAPVVLLILQFAHKLSCYISTLASPIIHHSLPTLATRLAPLVGLCPVPQTLYCGLSYASITVFPELPSVNHEVYACPGRRVISFLWRNLYIGIKLKFMLLNYAVDCRQYDPWTGWLVNSSQALLE